MAHQSLRIRPRRNSIPNLRAWMRYGFKDEGHPMGMFTVPEKIDTSKMEEETSPPPNDWIRYAPFDQLLVTKIALLRDEPFDLTIWWANKTGDRVEVTIPMRGVYKIRLPRPNVRIGIKFYGKGLRNQKWHMFRLNQASWETLGLTPLEKSEIEKKD